MNQVTVGSYLAQRLEEVGVMDVFEHAFMLEYGLKRADYIEAFFKTLTGKRSRPGLNNRD